MATGFRNVIIAAACYIEGNSFVGNTASIKLPDLEMRMSDDTQMGLPGTIERFFGIEKMTAELVFNTIDNNILKQFGSHDVRDKNYMVRYSTQANDGTAKYGVAEFAGRANKIERPAIADGEEITTTTLTVTCIQYKETFDGTVIFDIDIEAPKIMVDGVDRWAPIFEGL